MEQCAESLQVTTLALAVHSPLPKNIISPLDDAFVVGELHLI